MIMSKYCKDKGFTREEYKNFKYNIKTMADVIADSTKETHGMYYSIDQIIKYNANTDIKHFLIQELKKLGFEFIEDYTLYRY